MITDLNVAGFDERKSRTIVQAVVDTTASLGLATHKNIDALKVDTDALKATVDKIYIWLRWGFSILFAFMLFLAAKGG